MNYSIDDYNLTAEQLEVKYERRGEHPEYSICRFYNEHPHSPDYWPWAVKQLEAEAEELKRDNPYAPNTNTIPHYMDSEFPTKQDDCEGVQILDYYAAKAMQGMLTNPGSLNSGTWQDATPDLLATYAFRYARAMLKARQDNTTGEKK